MKKRLLELISVSIDVERNHMIGEGAVEGEAEAGLSL
jgi:hypothetical protein